MEPEREEERETERESLLLERFETMEVEKVFFRYIGKMVSRIRVYISNRTNAREIDQEKIKRDYIF